ncbi:MAG: DUF2975 domain-containing protein [Oscillospiraceae bacterium]|nr:DUF2975 domain-containing protein [Oscillospiraceae bacterium]
MSAQNRSVTVTSILIKVALVLCTGALFAMPFAAQMYKQISIMNDDVTVPLLITFYSCAAAGFVILFVLDRLVGNIRKGEVFIPQNIKYLRILSYCCFIIAVITLIFARFRLLAFIVTFAAAFIGLILRVIKNCFEEAVRLKEENEFTI